LIGDIPPITAILASRISPRKPEASGRALIERIEFGNPIRPPLRIDFKKRPDDALRILDHKIDATVRRFQAIFDRKEQLNKLPAKVLDDLHWVADRFDWLCDNSAELLKFKKTYQDSVLHGLTFCKGIDQKHLKENYNQVARRWAEIREFGYFDICRSGFEQ
jgi:hypothetical protein